MKTLNISSPELRELILFAFRYALGRRTFASKTISRILVRNMHAFSKHDCELFKREIEHAIEHGLAGDECDIEEWKKVLCKQMEMMMSDRVEDNRSVMMAADPMFTIGRLRDEIQTLREITKKLDSAYRLARRSSRGYSRYCEKQPLSRVYGKILSQSESIYRSIDLPDDL